MTDPAETVDVPPRNEEFELSLFGPGVGECIVVHLGGQHWIVVDSCRTGAPARAPVAIEYLARLKVEPSCIRMVVATHWHDDHIRGLAQTLRAATTAELVVSSSLRSNEYFELLRIAKQREPIGSGVDEFNEIFALLTERLGDGSRFATPTWASPNRELWIGELAGERVSVSSLSPSDAAQMRSKLMFAEESERLAGAVAARRLVSLEPNGTAVVLAIRAGKISALLGSDLETTRDANDGWSAIVADHSRFGREPFQIIKVPHHGSPTAHHPPMWSTMTAAPHVSALTPYRAGKGIPQPEDIDRLRGVTDELYCTAQLIHLAPLPRRRTVERTIREVAKGPVRPVRRGAVGHVRIRAPMAGGSHRVDLFAGAERVAS